MVRFPVSNTLRGNNKIDRSGGRRVERSEGTGGEARRKVNAHLEFENFYISVRVGEEEEPEAVKMAVRVTQGIKVHVRARTKFEAEWFSLP